MKVLKFGGTSVGDVKQMNSVMELITDREPKIIVLSAMSGTTNKLVEISDYLHKRNRDAASAEIGKLEQNYKKIVSELLKQGDCRTEGFRIIQKSINALRACTCGTFNEQAAKTILAQGELISSALFTQLLQENGHSAQLIPALDFMSIDEEKAADSKAIREKLSAILKSADPADYYITQGFICRNASGEIDNLQRGGSDYTASLIGAAIHAEEVQIWTDIDGFRNNDPRVVDKTDKIEHLSFNEAAELAYFGAKILHPQTVLPAKIENIPVRLKNTMNPADSGTVITGQSSGTGIKAVAAKDNITVIKVRSYRMLMAYGFLKNIFEIFEFFKTPIDIITTSEVAVSLTIDNTDKLPEIIKELEEYGEVIVEKNQTIICIVGDMISEEKGFASHIFHALEGIPIRMISYGGSRYNISIVVANNYKQKTLQSISDKILETSEQH